jgi:hypothetical protein
MSVATYATTIKDKSAIESVRQQRGGGNHAKTQKRKYNENIDLKSFSSTYAHPETTTSDSIAVQNIHSQMNQNTNGDNDSDNSIGNFTPYSQSRQQPMQESMNTLSNANVQNSNIDMNTVLEGNGIQSSQSLSSSSLYNPASMENNYFGSEYDNTRRATEVYKKTIPNYQQPLKYKSNDDNLMQKLNYIITLLEDQKDEKTDNVTEEVVLYSFLGIFIIFVADSFSKVGKYVR